MQIGKVCLWCASIFVTGVAYATLTPAEQEALDRATLTSVYYVDQEVAKKQPTLNPTSDASLAGHVVMYTDTAGQVEDKPISDHLVATGNETQTGINDSLPTVGAVNTGLAAKQDTLGQNKTAGNVATYTATAGTLGEHAVYDDTAQYNANALIEAKHANSAIQKGLDEHLSCGGNAPGDNGPCWLWQINDQAVGTVYTTHAVATGG